MHNEIPKRRDSQFFFGGHVPLPLARIVSYVYLFFNAQAALSQMTVGASTVADTQRHGLGSNEMVNIYGYHLVCPFRV